ncbi:putative porin [Methylomonas sp. MO1]|uniref:putative porin n=1 Tax=Methylomonas sp. MO1 TaxID=3073619 RepID=UPI0028A44332|nr:putative porin [Methylomonas sp. MO1]MDT4288365.1 putative porin [Methylomonas sp. MO1]
MANKKQLMALALSGLIGTVQAGEKEELLKLRNTTTNLIKQLVKQGVITDKAANEMIKQAEVEAGQQVAEAKASGAKEAVPADEVRVAYVPDFVKDEIRQQVRSELREEVVGDVMQKAKNEQWGMPNALPDWIKRFKLSGDIRLRSQHEYMADENIANSYIDWQAVNERGGLSAAGVDQFLNTTTDRQHFRERLRLGIDAIVTDGLKAGVRLATGNQRDPVSTNQSLGFTGQKYDFTVDRAYLQYDAFDDNKFKWLTLSGGRIKNPWYTGGGEFTGGSELVWDTDLSFEGFAGTVRHRLGGSDSLMANDDQTHSVFATAGAFPLQESALSSDKWLFGGQVGVDWGFINQDNLKAALAYFDYVNVEAKQNTSVLGTCDLNTRGNTASRPEFMQGGNTLASICREGTGALASNPGMVGLASDYNIVNANISYEMAMFAPYRLRLSGDYAKNVGFNKAAVSRMLNGTVVEGKTNAWQFRADFGWPRAEVAGHWNVFAAYKYVERDAVLDAFTDSDFHLGGTNSKGWFIGGNYGLMKNVWLTGRWLSADIITGPPLGIDVLQIDVNTQF